MLIFVLHGKLFLYHIQFFSFYLDYGYAFHALLWKQDVNRCGITILIPNCQPDQSAVTTETDGEGSFVCQTFRWECSLLLSLAQGLLGGLRGRTLALSMSGDLNQQHGRDGKKESMEKDDVRNGDEMR